MASLKKSVGPSYVLGSMAASTYQASQSWSLLKKKKKPFNLQFFLLRTVLEMLLPNTCNRSLIHQKKITAFWEVSLQNRLLSIRLLSLLLIPEDFVEANGYLSCLDPQYGVYCPHLCSAEFPFSFRFIAPLMTSWSNSGTFQLRLVTRTVHSKV